MVVLILANSEDFEMLGLHCLLKYPFSQLPVATLFAKSLACVNRTRPNKEIMIIMRDIWTSNLEG